MILREVPPTAGLPPRRLDLLGPFGSDADLEQAVADFLGVPSVQLECSGTASLVVAFEYLKSRSARRTAIIPGYTCPLVVLAARKAGLRVVACDTVPGGFELDLDCLRRLVDADTLCVLPTHYGGALSDARRVRESVEALSDEIFVIEDAAQAFGASWAGRPVGTAGHIGIFSFAAGKGFTLFEGGGLIGESDEIRGGLRATSERLIGRSLRHELRRSIELLGYHLLYNPVGINLTYGRRKRSALARGDRICAAGDHFPEGIPLHRVGTWRRQVGVRSLRNLRAHLIATRARFHELSRALSDTLTDLDVHVAARGVEPTGTFVFVTFPQQEQCERALRTLWPGPLGVSKLFVHAIGDYPQLNGLVREPTPRARDLAARTLTITTSRELDQDRYGQIVATIASALAGQGAENIGHRCS